MKFAICNEFCQGWTLDRVFRLAADNGFAGVEIAPFTLAKDVNLVTAETRREIDRSARAHGVAVAGLHWLLVSPEGLYINHPDKAVRDRTLAYFQALIGFCGDVGGTKMVIGSPKQRSVMPGLTYEQAWTLAKELFEELLPAAERAGVDLCIEPLTTKDTDFIVTAAEGLRLCREINHPRFRLHLDVRAMCGEGPHLEEIIRPCRGWVGHFHANDANRSYPGSGNTDFVPVAKGLREIGYDEWVSVEVFDFSPGPEKIAGESARYLKSVFGG